MYKKRDHHLPLTKPFIKHQKLIILDTIKKRIREESYSIEMQKTFFVNKWIFQTGGKVKIFVILGSDQQLDQSEKQMKKMFYQLQNQIEILFLALQYLDQPSKATIV